MDLIANQNDVSSSAPAENRFSPQELAAAMRTSAETPPSDVKDPGKSHHVLDSELLFSRTNSGKEIADEDNSGERTLPVKKQEPAAPMDKKESESYCPGEVMDSHYVPSSQTPGLAVNVEFCTSSKEKEDESDLNCGKGGKKAAAPAQVEESYGLPPTIVLDMKEFITSMKPMKFTKFDNAATKLISKFRKTLVCPKCGSLHGHTPQGTTSNQYGGTAPFKCRSSVPQLLMMLPHDVISATGKVHREFCIKDAQLFAAWISSSKAEQKETILKRLRHDMDIDSLEEPTFEYEETITDFPDIDMSQEEEKLEQLKIDDSAEIPSAADSAKISNTAESAKIPSAADVHAYSDAEFRAVVIEELMNLRKKLVEVLDENKALRQENAVLKKYRPSPIELPSSKLPSSTTSLEPVKTYSDITKTPPVRQFTTIKRSRQEVGATVEPQVKSRPQVDLSLFTAKESDKEEKIQETSKLTFVYFKGLIRRPQSEYRALLDQIGFGGYKARDILFLSNDFLQILTYENCVEELIEKITKTIPKARHVKDADPTDPKNYEEHGNLSQKFLEAQYFVTMEGSVQRFKKLAAERPILTRTLHFLEKVVATKNVKYETTPSKPKIFLMNNFMVLQDLQDSIDSSSAPKAEQVSSAMEIDQTPAEASLPVPMETSQ